MNADVALFLSNSPNWKAEMRALRAIVLDCGLIEEFKWKQPCYTYNKKNVVMIAQFKNYCTLSFFKGTLLSDPEKWLVAPGVNSQSVRMLRFTDTRTITKRKTTIKAYIFEAIEVEKAGIKVEKRKSGIPDLPVELREKMEADPIFAKAFHGLTPGRQRGYVLYFSGAKQSATRRERIERYMDKILKGKGFHDCTCGHSKRMPTCDGSHKRLESR